MLRKSIVENMVLSIFGLYLGFKYSFKMKENTNTIYTLVSSNPSKYSWDSSVALGSLSEWCPDRACHTYSYFCLCCCLICKNVSSCSYIFLICPSLCNLRNLKRHLEVFSMLKKEWGRTLMQEIKLLVQKVIEHHKVLHRDWRSSTKQTCPE